MGNIEMLLFTISLSMGFDPQIALSVAMTESSLKTDAVGSIGEVGLFQLRPEYFAPSCKGVGKAYQSLPEKVSIAAYLSIDVYPSPRVLKPRYKKTLVCGQELFNPELNIRTAVAYLKVTQAKFSRYDGDLSFLAAYNAGHTKMKSISSPEVFPYVLKVSKNYAIAAGKLKKIAAN